VLNFRNCFITERDAHKGAKQLFLFLFLFFCGENPPKSPPGEASVLENFQKKKTKSPHFQEGKKKSFEIATF
jgi:hypothetical protein